MRRIDLIQLHHSGGSELDTPEQVARYAMARDEGFQCDPYSFHIWRGPDQGVGVNSWVVTVGRDIEVEPAGAKGHNAHAIAVVVHGDYSEAPLPGYALARLCELLVTLCRAHGLDSGAIRGHGELEGAATLCPGYDPAMVRDLVGARLLHGD